MFEVRVTDDFREFAARIKEFERRHLPFATSRALTETAKVAKADVVREMATVFDRPTPWTLNAFFVKASTRNDLTAFVGVRSFAGKGTPAWKYLQAEQSGGARNAKRFEQAFHYAGGGAFAMPGDDVPLDEYGNVSQGFINRVLASLRAGAEGGISQRNTNRLRKQGLIAAASVGKRSDFFVQRSPDGEPIAVIQVIGPGKIRPVFVFTKRAPVYRKRFDFPATVQQSIARNFNPLMRRYFDEAVKNVRGH